MMLLYILVTFLLRILERGILLFTTEFHLHILISKDIEPQICILNSNQSIELEIVL